MATRASRGVVLPLGLLDQLSRSEIKALVARQIVYSNESFTSPSHGSCFAAMSLWPPLWRLLRFGPPRHPIICALCAAIMAIELVAIERCSPRMLFESDLRAIRLCDNQRRSSQPLAVLPIHRAPLNEQELQKLGKAASISHQRISELLAARTQS